MNKNTGFPDIFAALANLFPLNEFERLLAILKALKLQKIDKLTDFLNKELSLKTRLFNLLTAKFKEMVKEDLAIILKTWYFIDFCSNYEENPIFSLDDQKNLDFLEEIADILQIRLIINDISKEKSLGNNISKEISVVFYSSSDSLYFIRMKCDEKFIKDYRKSMFSKRLCSFCLNLLTINECMFYYENCEHLVCGNCDKSLEKNIENNKYCEICREFYAENELFPCETCGIGFPLENLLKCGKCERKSCKLCFLMKGEINLNKGFFFCAKCHFI